VVQYKIAGNVLTLIISLAYCAEC